MDTPHIVWFRRDLRLADQAALLAAAKAGPVIPIYILDDETPGHRKMGGASRWWLHHSLGSLDKSLRKFGSRLILKRGKASAILAELARKTGALHIHALRHYEPWWRNAERDLQAALPEGCALVRYDGNYLVPPGTLKTGGGTPYKIYTPFWRALREHMPPASPLPAPDEIKSPATWPDSDVLQDWDLLPRKPDWASQFTEYWTAGEQGAMAALAAFAGKEKAYDVDRNMPSLRGSSFLSPHLHFGEISPAAIWHRFADASAETYLKEIVWRDYAQNVILQFPRYGRVSYKEKFRTFPWRALSDPQANADLIAWQKGQTGYPIVDAGMRELWASGWMHNRVRMIAASFLIKHLLIDWRHGEQWFWNTLVDADYASNSVNWQWSAGCGVDANMFVRIMAPLSQSEKFDAGGYIRKWVPELSHLEAPFVHDPEEFGQRPATYPTKIITHKEARERALNAYRSLD